LRNPADARDYWYAPAMKFEPRASSCRTALCELALVAVGDAAATRRLDPAVEFFFELEPGARSVTKIYEAFLSPRSLQDAYHDYFGHYYVARALEHLPKSRAATHAQRQVALLKRQVEVDGSFVDAQAQGKSYSTAMAALKLTECLRWIRTVGDHARCRWRGFTPHSSRAWRRGSRSIRARSADNLGRGGFGVRAISVGSRTRWIGKHTRLVRSPTPRVGTCNSIGR